MRIGFEWFVAWRYLRERGRRASYVPLLTGLLLIVVSAVFFYLGWKRKPLHPADAHAGMTNWKQLYQGIGLGALVLGGLVGVFGYLYILQSVFTTISTFGVFLGTWALVIALSVMNGFEVDLRQKILGASAHVLVSKEDGAFTEWREVEQKLDGIPGVVAHTAYVSSEVVVAANSNYSGTIIKGIQPSTVGRVTDLEKNLEKGAQLAKLWPILPDGGVGEYSSRADAGPDEPDAGDDDPPVFDDDAGAEDEDEDEGAPEDFSGGDDDVDAGPPDAGPRRSTRPPRRHRDAGLDEDIIGELGPLDEPDLPRSPPVQRIDPRVASLDGILVGKELAANLHLYVGQEVQVVSPLGQDTPTGQVPRVRHFRVAGTFYSGMYEYDTKLTYVTLPALQSFLSLGDEVNGIEIKISDIDDTRPVVKAIGERLGPGYRVQDWKELNRNLFSALKLEKIAMFLVLTIIILVASFSIISNLIMVVVEKAREIAILKGMGASDPGIMRIFMIEGLYIGALGSSFGITIGLITCWALERFGLPLDPDVYYINKLPVAMDPVAIAMVAVAGVAISFIATLYPSYVAARLRPVDGLRYE